MHVGAVGARARLLWRRADVASRHRGARQQEIQGRGAGGRRRSPSGTSASRDCARGGSAATERTRRPSREPSTCLWRPCSTRGPTRVYAGSGSATRRQGPPGDPAEVVATRLVRPQHHRHWIHVRRAHPRAPSPFSTPSCRTRRRLTSSNATGPSGWMRSATFSLPRSRQVLLGGRGRLRPRPESPHLSTGHWKRRALEPLRMSQCSATDFCCVPSLSSNWRWRLPAPTSARRAVLRIRRQLRPPPTRRPF